MQKQQKMNSEGLEFLEFLRDDEMKTLVELQREVQIDSRAVYRFEECRGAVEGLKHGTQLFEDPEFVELKESFAESLEMKVDLLERTLEAFPPEKSNVDFREEFYFLLGYLEASRIVLALLEDEISG